MRIFKVLLFIAAAAAGITLAHDGLPVNENLGVPGFPDCVQTVPDDRRSNAKDLHLTLECAQKKAAMADQITIGCIGDSITAGVHSSGGNHTYPGQLQILLDAKYPDKYVVTNLGACGSTMMKSADSPYWDRPQYTALTSAKWDILIIMLGTNDAKDAGSHGPHNWPHNCTGSHALDCPYAEDYQSMISLAHTLGSPEIFVAIPPPLMQQGAYGMNQSVINDVFPNLIPAIAKKAGLKTKPIDIFDAMGGKKKSEFPPNGCTLDSTAADCGYFCDKQSCDQCHPDDVGYHAMAGAMMAGIGL